MKSPFGYFIFCLIAEKVYLFFFSCFKKNNWYIYRFFFSETRFIFVQRWMLVWASFWGPGEKEAPVNWQCRLTNSVELWNTHTHTGWRQFSKIFLGFEKFSLNKCEVLGEGGRKLIYLWERRHVVFLTHQLSDLTISRFPFEILSFLQRVLIGSLEYDVSDLI